MTNEQIVNMRDTMKCGMNLPLRIHVNNTHRIIDESNTLEFVIWDDVNGRLYQFTLPGMMSNYSPDNRSKNISTFCITYEAIEAMEIALLPLEYLDKMIESIKSSGRAINDDFKKLMINTYTKILCGNYADLSHQDINDLIGSDLNTNDDYYNNKFTTTYDKLGKDTITKY